jgi:hypothetical protein
MSMTNTPYGLRAINRNDGMPYAGATSQFLINPAGLGSNLFFGQAVIINANGYIALATATGSDLTTNNLGGVDMGAWGVFVGVPTSTHKASRFTVSTTPPAQPAW